MTKRIISFIIAGSMLIGSLSAQVYFQRLGLTETDKNTAASLAVGGSSMALGANPVASLRNPALLYSSTAERSLYTNVNLAHFTERRSFPVQDYFGDYLVDNDYVSNRYQKLEGDVAFYYATDALAFSAGWYTFEDYSYHYNEQIRADEGSGSYYRDPLAGTHQVDFSGTLQGYNIGLAHTISDRLRMGYSFSGLYAIGMEEAYGVIPHMSDDKLSSQDTTYFITNPQNGGGSDVNIGLSADVTERLTAGLSMNLKGAFTLNGTQLDMYMDSTLMLPSYTVLTDTTSSWMINRPNIYSFSLAYIPVNEFKTTLYLQADLTDWSGYSIVKPDTTWDPNYKAQWTLRGGVEHILFTGVPIRFGFVYENNPMSKELNKATISFGSGWISDDVTVNIGLAYYENLYHYSDIFPVEDEFRESSDKVKENGMRANLSLSWRF